MQNKMVKHFFVLPTGKLAHVSHENFSHAYDFGQLAHVVQWNVKGVYPIKLNTGV